MDQNRIISQLPALAEGEIFIGAYCGPDGRMTAFTLLPGDQDSVTWAAALEWAKSIGGDLPNRVEALLLFVHAKGLFEERAYWACDHDENAWAWYQNFGYGPQYSLHKDDELRARAVRRWIIQ